uniref:Uncharacterized protein n=1 Tax=Arundo donax TaxID=35708 RepID=A0A0A9DXI7_ARUDO
MCTSEINGCRGGVFDLDHWLDSLVRANLRWCGKTNGWNSYSYELMSGRIALKRGLMLV